MCHHGVESIRLFERSTRIVKFDSALQEGRLRAVGKEDAWDRIENLAEFRDLVSAGDYLRLERQSSRSYRIIDWAKSGSVLHGVYQLASDRGLESGFSESVEGEVERILADPVSEEVCEDWRHVPFVTVDGAGTMDLDQALFVASAGQAPIEVGPDCAYLVCYAIADASWFIRPGTALYEEALARGASIYFAGMSVPMLPHALSRGMISLNPCVDRRALVFVMQIDRDGVCTKTVLVRAMMRSRAKLTNDDVDAFLRDSGNHPFAETDYAASLLAFREASLLRLRESRTRNVVHFNRIALDISLNGTRDGFVLGLDERSPVDLYNEQLSLLCNMEGARILNRLAQEDPGVLAIFRNHEALSARDLDELNAIINAIAQAQFLPEAWFWDRSKQSLADYLEGLVDDDERLGRIQQAIERQILMMQRRSFFSTDAGLHSALGVNPYARFSAPMREVVGIFTHQEAIGACFPEAGRSSGDNVALRERVIQSANRARSVQREMDKAVDSYAIACVIGHDCDYPPSQRPSRTGTILGMKPGALYVRLDMPPIELKVYVRDIVDVSGQGWRVNASMTRVESDDQAHAYVVGDSISLCVLSYHAVKDKWRVVPSCFLTRQG